MEGSCNDPIFLWILVTNCPFQRSVGHVITCSVIPSGIVPIDNYTEFKSGCFEVFVFLLLGLNNFEIQVPDPSTDPSDQATTRFMKYHVQVQQQLLYDFMISSAFPFLALNFTPVSMACHRHTCTPCPLQTYRSCIRRNGMSRTLNFRLDLLWSEFAMNVMSMWGFQPAPGTFFMRFPRRLFLGETNKVHFLRFRWPKPKRNTIESRKATFIGCSCRIVSIAFWGWTNHETMLYSWLGTLRNGFGGTIEVAGSWLG